MVVHSSVAKVHRMCSLERFLCCMELEPGAIFLGWFSFIKNFLTMIAAFIVILIRIFVPCPQIVEWLNYLKFEAELEKCIHYTEEGYVSITAFCIIVLYIGLTYISYKFVAATKTRKHKEVIPFMTYLAFMTITSFLFIIKWTTSSIIFGILTGLFYGYFLLCVGAMYEIFLHEHNQKQRAVNYFIENQEDYNYRGPTSDTSDGISTRSEAGSRKLSC
ncbi:uncharacterized protein [Chironomus tepperi]|uniref:uncharacterized protein n=1 Tax=Chironomus tepperi TaxID=113505 RepID=UPI00391F838B